jgi:tRNA(adenine34) deaminase
MMEDTSQPMFSDEYYMMQAIRLAEQALEEEEVPIGALVVCQNRIIGKGYNQVERLRDATAHAEMLAFTAATEYLGSKHLVDCTLYVTIEPCTMCAGASRWVQVPRIVYGASEPKTGYSIHGHGLLHPKTEVIRGVLSDECASLMKRFFQSKRGKLP